MRFPCLILPSLLLAGLFGGGPWAFGADPAKRLNAPTIPRLKARLRAEMERTGDPLLAQFESASGGTGERAAGIGGIRWVDPDEATGVSRAVVVDDVPLAHTGQVLPLDAAGKLAGEGDAAKQAEQVLVNLDQLLQRAKSSLQSVIKLNIFVARDAAVPEVQKALAKYFSGPVKPAVAFVTGELPVPGALVAVDVVAGSTLVTKEVRRWPDPLSADGIAPVAVLPAGPKLYVSGMADTNRLVAATRKTLEKLVAAIGHLGSQPTDIVQLKVFFQPMSEIAAVRKEVADFFGGQAPPTVFVEWISANPPVEIELIAATRGDSSKETITFLTPPGTTSTKVYSRVARVNHGKQIYLSGLYGMNSSDAAGEIREIFGSLRAVLEKTGSDFERLVKATYYVTDDDASKELNTLRPEYYNPQRPPAASKAKVQAVGVPGKTVTIDMIAVTR